MRKYLLLGLVAALVLTSCRSLKDPVFEGIETLSIDNVGLDNSTLTLYLRYFNPNSSGARLTSANGEAWMENNYLGRFTVDTTIRIPAKDTFRVPVKLSVDMKTVLKNSIALLLQKQVNLRIEGEARAGRNGIYRRFPLRYEGKQDLKKIEF